MRYITHFNLIGEMLYCGAEHLFNGDNILAWQGKLDPFEAEASSDL